jgi:pimeloyl-ACP methyl ester carboxylesterase
VSRDLTTTPLALDAGTLDVYDSGGDGQPIVFGHGLVMDHTQWSAVIDELVPEFRCVVPVLPLGGHRRPMPTDADLTMRGIALLLAAVIEALDLAPVVLVANDWGGPQITAAERPDLLAGLVLTPEEAFDNFPPGLPGAFAALSCRLPGGLSVAGRSLRIPGFQRLPMTFGRMTVRPIPREMLYGWTEGLVHEPGVRRDVRRYVATTPKDSLLEAAEQLRDFPHPTAVVWSTDDRTMPRRHGQELADLIPGAELTELDDCSVLMPLDRPAALATEIRDLTERI